MKRTAIINAIFLPIGIATLGLPAAAASFNCQDAHTLVEFSVCAYPELSTLDLQIEKAYRKTQSDGPDSAAEARRQRDWLSERNRCTTLNCLMDVYGERAASLLNVHGPYGGQPLAGAYESTTDSSVGRLDLLQTTVGRVKFQLDFVSELGSRKHFSGEAGLAEDTLTYSDPQRDCLLAMRVLPGRILVNQSGKCGFAQGETVSGTYHQSIDKAPIFRNF
jgi:uncharacterized protein YecT (DUF1311 family)